MHTRRGAYRGKKQMNKFAFQNNARQSHLSASLAAASSLLPLACYPPRLTPIPRANLHPPGPSVPLSSSPPPPPSSASRASTSSSSASSTSSSCCRLLLRATPTADSIQSSGFSLSPALVVATRARPFTPSSPSPPPPCRPTSRPPACSPCFFSR
ncbi:hypothetical protein PUN28_008525 [Cardiocondyla obscurior]|uniref:Uncharacterized protein n=1 Tax=Cardiocondyla obscurior TaxID=286306 RepID=A0AAW2G0F9_9HYME